MEKNKRITSITELAPQVRDVTIVNSATGEDIIIPIKDLMPEQLAEISRRVEKPVPPIAKGREFRRNPITGAVEPEYNFEDPDYKYKKEIAEYAFVREWLLESLAVEIPGENHDEKLESMKKFVPFWALLELKKRLDEVNGLSLSEVAMEKKASKFKKDSS